MRHWGDMTAADPDEFERTPELDGEQPGDALPSRARRLRIMRIVALAGLAGLVLPGLVSTVGVQARTAEIACERLVEVSAPGAVAAVARFELFGGDGPAWYCYARAFDGSETLLRTLGLIPGPAAP